MPPAGRLAVAAALLLAAGPGPAAADEAFVTNQSSEDLSIVVLAAADGLSKASGLGETVATVPIGGKPAGIALSPDGLRAYVTSPEGPFLTIVDTDARTVERRVALDGGPLGIAVNPATGAVYVADWYEDRLFVLGPDGDRRGELATGDSPSGVAVSPDGGLIVTADRDDDQLSLFDAQTLTRLGTVTVGTRPFGVTIDAAGRFAYTANVGSNDVSIVDIAARKVVATVPVGERPYAVALARGLGFSTDQYAETVTAFDLETHRPVRTIDVGEYPEGIMASADGARVYVANWFSNTLSVIDTGSLSVVGEIDVGDGPRAFGVFLRDR